jgi:hypothetical protein
MLNSRAVAEAFSSHRFADVYDALAEEVVWAVPGQPALVGRSAVESACDATTASLRETRVTVLRFLVIDSHQAVAVDSVTRYVDLDETVSLVSSSDFYEFADGLLTAITSYAVELGPDEPHAYIGAA